MDKPETCPECDSFDMHTIMVQHRRQAHMCYACGWGSVPFVPEKKEIKTTKIQYLRGWHYEMFDEQGQIATSSQSFPNAEEVEAAAHADVDKWSKVESYGPCTAVIWPTTVEVQAYKVIRCGVTP